MSGKLKKPKYTGMKIYCNVCKRDNPSCRHYDNHVYRFRLHIKGSEKGIRSKTLTSRDYDEAVDEAIAFKKQMVATNYKVETKSRVSSAPRPVQHTLLSTILRYDQYLAGKHELVHLRKDVSTAHRKETIRFCVFFSDVVKKSDNIEGLPIEKITQHHVASFYSWAESKYASATFNKMMAAVKGFFEFVITVEKVKMENPFAVYVTKEVSKREINILSKEDFNSILSAVDNADPIAYLNNGVKKNMYFPYLKTAFQLFALTGGRREEVVDLKWSDLMMTMQKVRFFQVDNIKVEKQNKTKNRNTVTPKKFFPVNADLFDLLQELGYEEHKGTDQYIIEPDRTVTTKTIMDRVSKAFSHFRKAAGITKEVSLDELRKTYLTWMNAVMNIDTRILSSHANSDVLDKHYLDPTIISALEKAALEFKVFGT